MVADSGPAITRVRGLQLARSELARSIYRPSLLTRWWHDIESWLSSLVNGQSAGRPSWWGFILLAVGLLAVAAAVAFWLGPTTMNRQVRNWPVLDAKPRSAAEYRAAAERLVATGDYQAAIVERLRAIAVGLEAREILLPVPARTAKNSRPRPVRHFRRKSRAWRRPPGSLTTFVTAAGQAPSTVTTASAPSTSGSARLMQPRLRRQGPRPSCRRCRQPGRCSTARIRHRGDCHERASSGSRALRGTRR